MTRTENDVKKGEINRARQSGKLQIVANQYQSAFRKHI